MRWATCSRVKGMRGLLWGLATGSNGPLLYVLLVVTALEDAMDEDAGGMDLVRVQLAYLDQVLGLDDGRPGGHGHQRREVAGRLAEDAVSPLVRFPGAHQGEVGLQ